MFTYIQEMRGFSTTVKQPVCFLSVIQRKAVPENVGYTFVTVKCKVHTAVDCRLLQSTAQNLQTADCLQQNVDYRLQTVAKIIEKQKEIIIQNTVFVPVNLKGTGLFTL